MKLTRRNFIKTSVAGLAGTTIASGVPLKAEAREITSADYGVENNIFLTCRMCAQNCPMVAYVRDGRLVRIEANPNTPYPSICGRGRAAAAALYDPQRIKTPLIRTGKRGSGEFRSASWNEALDLIGNKMLQLRDEGEPHSVAYFPRFNTASLLDDTIFNLYGTDNVFSYGDTCFGSTNQLGLGSVFGGGEEPRQGNSSVMGDYENAKLAVLIGRNPVGGLVAFPWGGMFGRGRKNGMKTVLVDPKKSLGVGETDTEWLPVIPGGDIPFLIGLAGEIFKNNYYDEAFLREYTNADILINTETLLPVYLDSESDEPDYMVYDEVSKTAIMKSEAERPALFADCEVDGVKAKTALQLLKESCEKFTLEQAAEKSGISKEQIIKLAKDLNDVKPACFLERGYRSTRYFNSLHEKYLISSINGLLGVYGRKGGLIYGRYAYLDTPFSYNDSNEISVNAWIKENVKGFELADPYNLRRTFPLAVEMGEPYKLRMAFLNGQNPVGGSVGGHKIAEAFEKMEMVAAISPFWNESLLYADVILPDTTFLERSEPLFGAYKATFPVLTVHNQVVEPMFDTRNGYWIMLALAKRIFTDDEYYDNFHDFELGGVNYIVDYQLENLALDDEDAATFSRRKLIEDGVWCGVPAPVKPMNKPTPSGKLEVYSLFMANWHNRLLEEDRKDEARYYSPLYDYPPTYYQTKKEKLDNDEFIPITGFSPLSSFTGAQTRNNILLKNVGDKLNYSAVFINTKRGKDLGLSSGDIIEIFNIEEPSLIIKSEVQLTETVEPHALFSFYGVGTGLYTKLSEKLSVACPIGFNPNHIGNLTFMPVEASAPSQDFIVKIRRAK